MNKNTSRYVFWALIASGAILVICIGTYFLSATGYIYPILVRVDNRLSQRKPIPVTQEDSFHEPIYDLIEKHSRQSNADGNSDYAVSYQDDVNSDGTLDTIMGAGDRLRITVTNKGKDHVRGGYSAITSVGFDDVDGDQYVDAWFCDSADGLVEILWGNGKGDFPTLQYIHTGPHFGIEVAFSDMDGDKDLDLVMSTVREPGEYFWIQLERIQGNADRKRQQR